MISLTSPMKVVSRWEPFRVWGQCFCVDSATGNLPPGSGGLRFRKQSCLWSIFPRTSRWRKQQFPSQSRGSLKMPTLWCVGFPEPQTSAFPERELRSSGIPFRTLEMSSEMILNVLHHVGQDTATLASASKTAQDSVRPLPAS